MTQAIDRQLEKARAKHRKVHPPDAIFILCDAPEDLPLRVDVLIAAGNLTEADRPRCVICNEDAATMTHEQQVDMLEINETAEDRRCHARRGRRAFQGRLGGVYRGSRKGKKRFSRFPVDRL